MIAVVVVVFVVVVIVVFVVVVVVDAAVVVVVVVGVFVVVADACRHAYTHIYISYIVISSVLYRHVNSLHITTFICFKYVYLASAGHSLSGHSAL